MRYQARMHTTLDILCDSLGRVFLPENGPSKAHWTFGSFNTHGYRRVKLAGKQCLISRLICETFHGLAPEDKPICDHIDRNRDWNVPWNLRWADRKLQNNNRQVCIDSLKKYGVRACENPVGYQRERYANDPEYAERRRAKARERYAQNAEQRRARFGINRQLPLF